MILAIDVQYVDGKGIAAGVLFEDWQSGVPVAEYTSETDVREDYVPGEFYKRELPCILKLLDEHALSPDTIVIDGHVFLDEHKRPGLGKYLYDALGGETVVVGVAKNAYAGMGEEHAVVRGNSRNPLYITVAGDSLESAKANVQSMQGGHRIPLLLKRADQLCRDGANKRNSAEK